MYISCYVVNIQFQFKNIFVEKLFESMLFMFDSVKNEIIVSNNNLVMKKCDFKNQNIKQFNS